MSRNRLIDNLFLSCQIIFKFCTSDCIIAVLCANCQNDLATEMHIMDERSGGDTLGSSRPSARLPTHYHSAISSSDDIHYAK